MEIIDCPAYVVIDIPSPMAEKIRLLRSRFDAARSMLPAEVTLTGSCGVGLIRRGSSMAKIQSDIDEAARKIHPFQAQFKNIERFSGTNIFFLTFQDESPFEAAHKMVASCGIQFDPSPYPYKPHCTLVLRKEPENAQELLNLFFLNIPKESFRLDTISVYALPDPNSCELVHKAILV